MSWREFIASVADSLAWPVALVLLMWLLRGQLAGLLTIAGPLRRLKLGPGGAEAEWDSAAGHVAVSSVRAQTVAAGGVMPTPDDGLDADLAEAEQFVEKTPVLAVQRAWLVVERELQRVMDVRGAEPPPPNVPRSSSALIKAAWRGGAISRDTADALRGLLVLRDLSAHDTAGTSVSPEKAAEFLLLARAVLHTLSTDRGGEPR